MRPYPKPCGCKGSHFDSMCETHQAEYEIDARRFMGIAELTFTHRQLTDVVELGHTLFQIKLWLIEHPTKPLLIKINPGESNETNASSRD